MDSGFRKLAREVFDEVVEIPRAERDRFLDDACAGDDDLRREVEGLIRHFEAAGDDYLATPAVDFCGIDSDSLEEEEAGRRIGRFSVIRKIGEGGMGVVYEARQDHPSRTVALKVIRPGFASRNLLRRFEFEAEVLGRLQHPGIAHIYEAGTAKTRTPSGAVIRQPYFAMELIRGVALDAYSRGQLPEPASGHGSGVEVDGKGVGDSRLKTADPEVGRYITGTADPEVGRYKTGKGEAGALSIERRLLLVADICDAVQNAHLHGVIHRDLKPGNILVTESGQPKILDFGVARATDSDVHTVTMRTDIGQLVGTVPYMSPEQVAGDPQAVDTRSDVYSLGVILFELLTGRLPHDVTECSLPEAVRRIRDDEALSASAANRALRGEIDTIVAKAIAKEKDRRYQTAADFGADIRRYLKGEPIEARGDSAVYVLRKMLWRYRGLVAAGLVFVVMLGAFGVVSFVMAERNRLMAVRERESSLVATDAREAEATQRRAAEASREEAVLAAAKAEAANRFLTRMLRAPDPMNAQGPDVTVVDVLDEAGSSLEEGALSGQKEVEASIHRTLGVTYRELGVYDQAEAHLRKALTIYDAQADTNVDDWCSIRNDLGLVLYYRAQLTEAEAYFRMVLKARRAIEERRDDLVAQSLGNLSLILSVRDDKAGAVRMAREALARLDELGMQENAMYTTVMMNLSGYLLHLSRFDEAQELAYKVVSHRVNTYGEEHSRVAGALQRVAFAMRARGDRRGAERVTRKLLGISIRTMGEDHPFTATAHNNLGGELIQQGGYAEGEMHVRLALAIFRDLYGDDHRGVSSCLSALGGPAISRGDFDEATALLYGAWEINRRVLGDEHGKTLVGMSNIAFLLKRQGQIIASLAVSRELLRLRRILYGDQHMSVSTMLLGIGRTLTDLRKYSEAEACLRECLMLRERLLPEDSVNLIDVRVALGTLLLRWDRYAEAEPIFVAALASRRRISESDEVIAVSLRNLGRCRMGLGRYEEAESDFLKSDALFVETLGEAHGWTRSLRRSLVKLYEKMGREDEAARWRELSRVSR